MMRVTGRPEAKVLFCFADGAFDRETTGSSLSVVGIRRYEIGWRFTAVQVP